MNRRFDLTDQVAVVIGGAGGLGEACASELGSLGAKIVVASRNLDALDKAAHKIQDESGVETAAFAVDVTEESSVKELAEKVEKRFGTVDILVNTHGMNIKRPVLEYPVEDWDRMFAVNVKGVMLPCKTFGKLMVDKKKGKIINMSSVRGIRGTDGGNMGYGATKGAVDMITRMLAAEFAPFNVNVNAIGPSLVLTETIKRNVAPERLEILKGASPMKRMGTPQDVAGVCAFLASSASDYMTGQILYIDGGLTAVA
jgi:NAD(P)-dependent dehydrogenase (short-subunit alcohol dehydrogenase family)